MSIWQIQDAKERAGIDEWGAGYFSINRQGHVVCTPLGESKGSISLPEVIEQAKALSTTSPMIIRFPQIIKEQMSRMSRAFGSAIAEFQYTGKYRGAFPFKVNQRREFIDAIVSCGQDLNWGLEVGSKTEFMAAMSYAASSETLLIANGFKDREFIEMGFIAKSMGRNVVLVIEGPDELHFIMEAMESMQLPKDCCPSIGIRVRLYSRGSGKWEKSSGEESKFGLTTTELLQVLNLLEHHNLKDKLMMLHFHIGSQVTAIKRFKNALREAARVYSKITKLGFAPKYLNIGGGVGVDYDGSQTSAISSVNYNLQEFANDAVYVIGEVCKNEGVYCPDIVTESGRVLAAYHSVVVTDIREVQSEYGNEETVLDETEITTPSPDAHKYLNELRYILTNMSEKNASEFYHDAVEHHEDLFTLFSLGYISLRERAFAEDLFSKICMKVLRYPSFSQSTSDEFQSLRQRKTSKYLANFSIFQSIPDAWAIGQLFPILPLSRHSEPPSQKATIVDITCDSDGCIERFIDRRQEKTTIELHDPDDRPYYLGFFLVGAYQESLANEHNLFGAINEVEVTLAEDGSWSITKLTSGDPIKELLICRNYDLDEMLSSYQKQLHASLEQGRISREDFTNTYNRLEKYLSAYPYLVEK